MNSNVQGNAQVFTSSSNATNGNAQTNYISNPNATGFNGFEVNATNSTNNGSATSNQPFNGNRRTANR